MDSEDFMPKKVLFFVGPDREGAPMHFTLKFAEAVERKGIEVAIVDTHDVEEDSNFLKSYEESPPDFTASFFQPVKLPVGKYIWEITEVLHIAFLLDSVIYFMELAESPNLILTSMDRSDIAVAFPGRSRVLFFPPGVEPDLASEEKTARDIDVVFFGSCFDFIGYRREWKKKLSGHFNWVIDFATDIALINSSITLTEALRSALETAGLNNRIGEENFQLLYHYFEKFMIGKDRFELLYAIRDAPVHVYGESLPMTEDFDYPEIVDLFHDNKNIVFHPPVSYEESLNILKRSKICLNSFPSGRDGANHRPFEALACGSLPMVTESRYISESLSHGEDILYFKANHWHEVNDWIKQYLGDEKLRQQVVLKGREKVMRDHTWDVRLRQLLQDLISVLYDD